VRDVFGFVFIFSFTITFTLFLREQAGAVSEAHDECR